jgi:hypothetical protein
MPQTRRNVAQAPFRLGRAFRRFYSGKPLFIPWHRHSVIGADFDSTSRSTDSFNSVLKGA